MSPHPEAFRLEDSVPSGGEGPYTRGMFRRDELVWWVALGGVAVLGPWSGWWPPVAWGVAVVVMVVALGRPRGWGWTAVVPVALAALLAVVPLLERGVDPGRLERDLEHRCEAMLSCAVQSTRDPAVIRVFSAAGEVMDPGELFGVLDRRLGGAAGRTMYVVDDMGRVVAWAGEPLELPPDLRPLGERRWKVVWWSGSAALMLREPILVGVRVAGAVLVVDRTPRAARAPWGMRAGSGNVLRLWASAGEGRILLEPQRFPGVKFFVEARPVLRREGGLSGLLPWLLLALAAFAPRPAVTALAGLGGALAATTGGLGPAGVAVAVLAGAAGYGRMLRGLPAPRRLWAGAAVLLMLPVAVVLGVPGLPESWLPVRVLVPGWGGAWVAAVGLVLAGLLGPGGVRGLERRVAVGAAAALVVTLLQVGAVPCLLLRTPVGGEPPVIPQGPIPLEDVLPGPPGEVHLEDLALVLARRWGIGPPATPAEVVVLGPGERLLSVSGDLTPAGSAVATVARRTLVMGGEAVGRVEVDVATGPWAYLGDWSPAEPRGASRRSAAWFAVFAREGRMAATLHPGIGELGPEVAGRLFHRGTGWCWVRVDGNRRLARVERRGDWLVVVLANTPTVSVWFLQGLLALLLGGFATLLPEPPRLRRESFATFGGRLRLLVAGAVILPLVLLSAVLHVRLRAEESRVAGVVASDILGAVRWTAGHLAGGFPVGHDLAGWLSTEVGSEVLLFDGARQVGVSRPDLVISGVLPGLPVREAFVSFLLGREDGVVVPAGGTALAAGPVEIEGRRYLLQVVVQDPVEVEGRPGVVDWLITGALLAAVAALLVTSRVERRLGESLGLLMDVARRVREGEAVGEVPLPAETDLAQVVEAVRRMSREVQEREGRLRSQEELLRITLSTLAPAVVVFGEDGEVRLANPSGEELLLRHGEAVRRLALEDGGGGAERASIPRTVEPFPGLDVTWQVGSARVPLPGGGTGTVVVVDDVSDVVRADRLRQLTQLARIVAHEVKNPLTPIRLWVQEIEASLDRGGAGSLEGLLREACREISQQVERLRITASSFSNLVALEGWEPEEVDLEDLVASLDLPSVLERRGVRLVKRRGGGGHCRVVADRQWLRRALDNLLQNSLDVLAPGPGTIEIALECVGDSVVLEITDTGGGVPEAMLPELFSPRFSTTGSGSGLGLALVRQVITRCHGEVTAFNGPEGLVVRMVLPRASATMSP